MTKYPNWFKHTAQDNFIKHLKEFKGKPNLRFLQLGAFTGDASVWMLKNILTDKTSDLTDVDTWKGSDEEVHQEMDFADVYQTYKEKTKQFTNVSSHQIDSESFLAACRANTYDFIYVDADHTAAAVAIDAIHSWRLLKPGGIMAFDDFTWKHKDGMVYMPFRAIDFFCWAFQFKLEILVRNEQVWIRKLS